MPRPAPGPYIVVNRTAFVAVDVIAVIMAGPPPLPTVMLATKFAFANAFAK